jgi:hypothetical protein
MRSRLDKILNNWISRKLMVFIVASFGLFSRALTSSDWVIIATVYIGTVGALDIVSKLKQNNNNI